MCFCLRDDCFAASCTIKISLIHRGGGGRSSTAHLARAKPQPNRNCVYMMELIGRIALLCIVYICKEFSLVHAGIWPQETIWQFVRGTFVDYNDYQHLNSAITLRTKVGDRCTFISQSPATCVYILYILIEQPQSIFSRFISLGHIDCRRVGRIIDHLPLRDDTIIFTKKTSHMAFAGLDTQNTYHIEYLAIL